MSDRVGDWMQTYTGRAFWPLDPRGDEVDAEDIAHALSMQCRFAGHVREFYSVAEHCVRVSWWVPCDLALVGLLHDAAEAYLVDVPRPIKGELGAYKEIERSVARVIGERFGVTLDPLPDAVREADEVMLSTEKRDLLAPAPRAWHPLPPASSVAIVPWPPAFAKLAFLERLHELTGGRFGRDS